MLQSLGPAVYSRVGNLPQYTENKRRCFCNFHFKPQGPTSGNYTLYYLLCGNDICNCFRFSKLLIEEVFNEFTQTYLKYLVRATATDLTSQVNAGWECFVSKCTVTTFTCDRNICCFNYKINAILTANQGLLRWFLIIYFNILFG